MTERIKVRCPRCDAEMNFHAEKLDLGRPFEDGAPVDEGLNGVLVEFHTCPNCTFVLERPSG